MRLAPGPCARLLVCVAAMTSACGARAGRTDAWPTVAVERREVSLPSGRVVFDLYRPNGTGPHPLVIVAHGFWRSRGNMAGWGRHLAGQGFLTVVPGLPAWADHERNGRAVSELIGAVIATPPAPIDQARIGVIGFSAGGLSTLLAAANDDRIKVWVGLDPVDRDSKGAQAAPRVKASAVILRAGPSRCNANGNASGIERGFAGRATVIVVAGATHTDLEWPTDWKARLACGDDDEGRRATFVEAATAALKKM